MYEVRRIDSSKGNGYPLTGRNSLEGEIVKRREARAESVYARQLGPKLMPVPRSNLSADPVYYGPRSPFADEWSTIFLPSFRYFSWCLPREPSYANSWRIAITDSCFVGPAVCQRAGSCAESTIFRVDIVQIRLRSSNVDVAQTL